MTKGNKLSLLRPSHQRGQNRTDFQISSGKPGASEMGKDRAANSTGQNQIPHLETRVTEYWECLKIKVNVLNVFWNDQKC